MLAINNFEMLLIRSVKVPCHFDNRNVEYSQKLKPRSNHWRKPGTFVHLWVMTFVSLPPADTVLEVSRCYVTLSLYTDNSFTVFTMLRLFRSSFQYRNQFRRGLVSCRRPHTDLYASAEIAVPSFFSLEAILKSSVGEHR
jgi:hypothetical protein